MRQKLLTIKEAAEFLGLSVDTLYRLAQRGEVPCFKRGVQTSPWRFPRGALFNWWVRRWHQRVQERTERRLRTLRKKLW